MGKSSTSIIPVIRAFGHDNIPTCICGKSEFFTITCSGGNKFLWQNPDGSEGSGNPPIIRGLIHTAPIYGGQILSITICINCKVLQNFEFCK